jgi:hypothetical protein
MDKMSRKTPGSAAKPLFWKAREAGARLARLTHAFVTTTGGGRRNMQLSRRQFFKVAAGA